MEQHRIVRKPKLARRAAHDMIIIFARHGNHYTTRETFSTDASVKRAFETNRLNFEKLVESCRNPNNSVPFFENFIGSTWQVSSGASVSRVNMRTGEESTKVQGPGIYAPEGYWATYELSNEALNRAIDKLQYAELLSALVHGIAAIESFIASEVIEWNRAHPDDQLIDSREAKVSFDDKVDKWLPKVFGKKLDKSDAAWQHFKILRKIRDDAAIHPKAAGYGVKYQDIVDLINMYRTGVAGLLIKLHILAGKRVPRIIIRDCYAPDAVLEAVHRPDPS